MPKIECGQSEYRIVGDAGEEGPEMAYGLGNTMEAENGDLWAAHVDLDGEDNPVTKLPGGTWLHNLTDGTKLKDVECEEVVFEGDDEGDNGVDDDEDEDEDAIGDDEDDDDADSDDADEDEVEELKIEEEEKEN